MCNAGYRLVGRREGTTDLPRRVSELERDVIVVSIDSPSRDSCRLHLALTPRLPVNAARAEAPLLLNTGRVRDQWHTVARTGKSVRLAGHRPEPTIEIHPADAARRGVAHGDIARLTSAWGRATLRVHFGESLRQSDVFAPMHWTRQESRDGRVNSAMNPAVDPISGHLQGRPDPLHRR